MNRYNTSSEILDSQGTVGEFLHELELCEGHCTGIPTIQEELEKNGSPVATFETDSDRQSVCVTIPIHPRFLEIHTEPHRNHIENHTENNGEIIDVTITSGLTDVEKYILESIKKNSSITIKELSSESDYTVWQIRHYMDSLKNKGVLSRKGAQKNGEWIITSGEKRYE